MKRIASCWIAVLIVLVASTKAQADEVTDWNQTMLRAGLVAGTSPPVMTRVAALVQSAMFDAVNGIRPARYTPIRVAADGPEGASRRAAAVQAAYVMLSKLYPTQQATLDARRKVAMAVIAYRETGTSILAGTTWGEKVANDIWTWRLNDGFTTDPPTWAGNNNPGQWRPTPNAPAPGTSSNGVLYPQFFNMTTWSASPPLLASGSPLLTSTRYAKDFDEVRRMGSFSSTARTPDQTIFSLFWHYTTATYLWNSVALSLIDAGNRDGEERGQDRVGDWNRGHHNRNELVENARVFGELGVTMADAAIACWTSKYTYNFWRPITAIRETTTETAWTPLFATPAFPEYPSGHSCVSGAAGAVLADEFGNKTHFNMDSDSMIGVTRSFHTFSAALEEVQNARIFAGIHFRFATKDGQALGAAVAQYVLDTKFQRLH